MVLDSLSEDRQTSKAVAMRHNLTTLVQSKVSSYAQMMIPEILRVLWSGTFEEPM